MPQATTTSKILPKQNNLVSSLSLLFLSTIFITHIHPTMEALDQLMHILGHDFTTNLISSLAMLPAHSSPQIKVNAEICIPSPDLQETGQSRCHKIYLVRRYLWIHFFAKSNPHIGLLTCVIGYY